jgi:hypothetical protein
MSQIICLIIAILVSDYNSQKKLIWLKNCFDAYRLGEISNNIALAEPVLEMQI